MHHLVSYSTIIAAVIGWWMLRNAFRWNRFFPLLAPLACLYLAFPINRAYDRHLKKAAAAQAADDKALDIKLAKLCASWANPEWVAAKRWRELVPASGNMIYYMADAHWHSAPRWVFMALRDRSPIDGIVTIQDESQLDDMLKFHAALGVHYDDFETKSAREYLWQPGQYFQ